jgi:subtilisin family serine protease
VEYRSYWIANMIWARADVAVIAEIASRAEVRRLDANPWVRVEHPPPHEGDPVPRAIEWGLLRIQADQVWDLGFDGSDVVIGGQDTGYEWTHPALVEQYRGWTGSSADHDYNWHDAIHAGGGSCGPDSPEPCDDHGHGTHTMGTMVGDDGGANRTGVAPGARWIGCRNMDQGDGTPATYSECFQWFVAPTDAAGLNPDPSRAPHVINNSWSCPVSEGCSQETLETVVENTRAAGILVVVSAGNAGSGCSSIDVPPAIYQAAFAVGATDSGDTIASFSSRGPVTYGGNDSPSLTKPDVSAPGVSVRSSVRGGGYGSSSGTSMASPHVAGTAALLFDARPDLIGRVDEVEALLRLSATPRTTSQECGGIPGSEIPNPVYGHGRIDALAMIAGDADGDGVDNLADCSPANPAVWTLPAPTNDLLLEQDAAITSLSWSAPGNAGAGLLRYDVLRSASPEDFSSPDCPVSGTFATSAVDDDEAGSLVFYLVRPWNACGGNSGAASGGIPRTTGDCPETP